MSRARSETTILASSPEEPAALSGTFGDFRSGGATERRVTIPNAVRRCRWIALDVSASQFALFTISVATERTRLLPWFDHEHPGIGETTRLLAGAAGEPLVHHARRSAMPFWWDSDTGALASQMLDLPDIARRLAPPDCCPPGIAFPLFRERGQSGLVVFLGDRIDIGEDLCLDVHARSFALFESLTASASNDLEKAPVLSRRELECLTLTANGHTSEQIASALNLSVHTANQYLANSTQKLDAVNRTHAVAKALKLGLIA